MLNEQFYKELEAKDSEADLQGKETDVAKTVEETKEADKAVQSTSTSGHEREPRQNEVQSVVSWFQGRSASELAKLQEEDPDIGPILRGKLANTKPRSQEMTVRSLAARHY